MRNARTINTHEICLHDGVLKDLIAVHLHATSIVHDHEEVLEIVLGEPDADNIRPVWYKTIENREVEVIIHS